MDASPVTVAEEGATPPPLFQGPDDDARMAVLMDAFQDEPDNLNKPDMTWTAQFMAKSTLERYRELARDLHEDLLPYVTNDHFAFGMGLKHPLLWEPMGMHFSPAKTNRRYEIVRADHDAAIAEGNWSRASILVADPCLFSWVEENRERMSLQDYREQLSNAWINTEFPFSLNRATVRAAFKRAGWMTDVADGDVNSPSAPPKPSIPVTLYRGSDKPNARLGMSWTAEPERAAWFARRWTKIGDYGYIWEATVYPDRIYAYFGRRGEAEFVINTMGLKTKEHRELRPAVDR